MTCCAGSLPQVYAEQRLASQRSAEISRSGQQLSGGGTLYTMSVPAVHCGSCVSTIERTLKNMPGVRSARVNLSMRTLLLTKDTDAGSIDEIVRRLETLGYPPVSLDDAEADAHDGELKSLTRALAVAGFAAANIMLLSVSVWTGADGATRDLFHFLSALIAIPTVAYAGRPFFKSAISALSSRRMNMDVPISLGVLLATFMSLYESLNGGHHAYFDAAVSLLFFLLIGRTLDRMMRGRARQLISGLARLSAKGGMTVSPDGVLTYTPLEDIRPGMILRVAAGERVPADGVIATGMSDIDRSLVTGESKPVSLGINDVIEAGVMNLTGSIDIRVTRLAKESFLSDVMRMMQAAELGRGNYVRIADRMAALYSPAVHVLAFATFLGWLYWTAGDWHQSLTIAIAVLIITCPCALGLAVPVAHVVSASRLFNAGILMKDGSALERLAEANHIVFDKTGTLTTGEPVVSSCDIPNGVLRTVAAALARHSMHPASRAAARYLAHEAAASLQFIREVVGQGISAIVDGREARLGHAAWVAEIANDSAAKRTGLAFALQGGDAYGISLAENLRAGASQCVGLLKSRDIALEMLSGDAQEPVAIIAEQLGIDQSRASLNPGGKLARIEALARQGKKVLMIGDGLNDAPCLAAAHVSMAPSSASDVGRNAADFVFTRENLSAVAFALDVAKRTRFIVQQNFGLAIAYNVLAVPLAMAGYLNPLIAAIAMSTSSIIVVGNSLRLTSLRSDGGAVEAAHPALTSTLSQGIA